MTTYHLNFASGHIQACSGCLGVLFTIGTMPTVHVENAPGDEGLELKDLSCIVPCTLSLRCDGCGRAP